MTQTPLPKVTRTYQNHHLDSTRWRIYSPRDDDTIISTSYKAGTTWLLQILLKPWPVFLNDLVQKGFLRSGAPSRWRSLLNPLSG